MKIITVATDLNNFFLRKFLVPSCEYFGFDLVILYAKAPWESHRMKDKLLIPYLKQLNSNELILFTDAYDTMMLNNAHRLMELYSQLEGSFIFSSETNCFPEPDLSTVYHKIKNNDNNNYLNSGGFICRSNHILKILSNPSLNAKKILEPFGFKNDIIDHYDKRYGWSNQYYWTLKYFSMYPEIEIDTDSRLFLTTGTPLDLFKESYGEYTQYQEQSNLYKKEKNRLRNMMASLKEKNVVHLHFFNTVSNHIFREFYLTNSFPKWIYEILDSKKIIERAEVIEF
ncbi:hypothetical protein SAMN02927921_03093 [Sinomicrobium oceani]|uniref:PLOD1-3-like GT domain-containing protein n=1 Tax=Sinomicrobium oceani TaxID=1150368 RepID=A0A1K1R2E3_9FLAO|nr:glycosyltransferase domain-containing protein [Sinomicrobium oceani]SFW66181.1 hypothetical protein SAMN02927921_03093 [Sinomicrobium oceani]